MSTDPQPQELASLQRPATPSADVAGEPRPRAVLAAHHPAAPADASAAAPGAAAGAAPDEDDDSPVSVDIVKSVLRRVKDPELSLNIVDLGLVYDIRVQGRDVEVDMSLTSPGCPSGPEIMGDAEKHLKAIDGVGHVAVNLVWSPFWTPDRIEPRVRAYLGM